MPSSYIRCSASITSSTRMGITPGSGSSNNSRSGNVIRVLQFREQII